MCAYGYACPVTTGKLRAIAGGLDAVASVKACLCAIEGAVARSVAEPTCKRAPTRAVDRFVRGAAGVRRAVPAIVPCGRAVKDAVTHPIGEPTFGRAPPLAIGHLTDETTRAPRLITLIFTFNHAITLSVRG